MTRWPHFHTVAHLTAVAVAEVAIIIWALLR